MFNGLHIGATFGHISQLGFGENLFSFVAGHGSFELTAIVLCGGAGLKVGYALLNPGSYKRILAVQLAAKEAIKIVYGAALMLLFAAFIEAYWSPMDYWGGAMC